MSDTPPENYEAPSKPLLVKDYYIFETTSFEWLWVIQNMIAKVKDEMGPHDVLLIAPKEGADNPSYYLKKTRFPADVIAKSIGTTAEKVEAAKIIRLKPFEKPEGLPEPTVGYYGVS